MHSLRFSDANTADAQSFDSAFGREHLAGLRRGTIFLVALVTAAVLFAHDGWSGTALTATQSASLSYCVPGAAMCPAVRASAALAEAADFP